MESSGMINPNGICQVIPPLSDRDHAQGSINATIVLMKYGDYQCPQSGQAHITIKDMQQRLGNQLCFIFRHFPQPNVHPQSQRAAESAEAANAQGKFWQMHDLLFEHQQNLSDADLVQYANQIGLDIPQFLRELTEHLHAERVQEDIESGHISGVTQTPTCFIGVRHQGCGNLDALLMTILESNATSYVNQ
jgi:protein-disulfide isomerase